MPRVQLNRAWINVQIQLLGKWGEPRVLGVIPSAPHSLDPFGPTDDTRIHEHLGVFALDLCWMFSKCCEVLGGGGGDAAKGGPQPVARRGFQLWLCEARPLAGAARRCVALLEAGLPHQKSALLGVACGRVGMLTQKRQGREQQQGQPPRSASRGMTLRRGLQGVPPTPRSGSPASSGGRRMPVM